MASSTKNRILIVANKKLPPGDYRVRYAAVSNIPGLEVVLGLPGRPEGVSENTYVEMGFGEGVGLADALHFARLLVHLAGNRKMYRAVHFFSTKLVLLGPIVAWLAGVPSLVTVTGFGRVFNDDGFVFKVLRLPYLALFRVAASLSMAVLFQNRGDMEAMRRRMRGRVKAFRWVGSGAEAPVCRGKDFAKTPLKVLLVSRLRADKGVTLFLDTAELAAGDDIEFTLAGPPSKGGEDVYPRVIEASEKGVLNYLGELDVAQLGPVYFGHHVLLFPSYGEGMSRVMIEAGHAMLCPVASDIPANRDLVAEGRSGFLVDVWRVGAPERFRRRLVRLAANRHQAEALARKYQADTVLRYSVRAYAARMDDVLEDLRLVVECSVPCRSPGRRN